MNETHGNYLITDDQGEIDPKIVHQWLSTTYWAKNRSPEIVQKSIENSFCFAVLYCPDKDSEPDLQHNSEPANLDKQESPNEPANFPQIGFARAVTDYATYALILDVFIHPDHRAQGLGQKLLKFIINHPKIAHTKRTLSTLDAENFYQKLGFQINKELKNLYIPAPKTTIF